jgi:DNA polymerase
MRAKPTVAVIGHGPGHKELEKGQPFIGPSGRLTMKLLGEAGLDIQDIAFLNVTCCGDKPAARHVEACRGNFRLQMEACAPAYALVLGGVATEALTPVKLPLRALRGEWWTLSTGQWAMATYHPAQFLYHSAPRQEATVRTDLHKFATSVLLRDLAPPKVSETCVSCFRWAEGYVQGLGFCREHYPKTKRKKGMDQMTLFQEL